MTALFHEQNFLPFGTHVLYQRVGLTQYLISHRLTLLYCEISPNTFIRNLSIYQSLSAI